MKKSDFYLKALNAGAYKRASWVIRAFAEFQEPAGSWQANPIAYDIVYENNQYYFIDPDNDLSLTAITDAPKEGALCSSRERIQISPKTVPNARGELETSYGNVLMNFILLIYPFGKKLPFMTGRFTTSDIENITAPLLKSDPLEGEPIDPEAIYVRDHLKFTEAAYMLTNYCMLAIPGDTEKSLTTSPRMQALKDELFEKYKDKLHDRSVLAKIGEILEAEDRKWLEGDASMGILTKAKDFNVIRKKLFLMVGDEAGFNTDQEANPIKKSLNEGLDLSRFPDYVDGSRAGSFDRGAQTALGGEMVKWLLRASSNITIEQDDCGTKLGFKRLLTKSNVKRFLGFSFINEAGKTQVLDQEAANSYLGQVIALRSPMYCKAPSTDFCKACAGPRLSDNPNAASTAITAIGDEVMGAFMKSMHGKALTTTPYNFADQLH